MPGLKGDPERTQGLRCFQPFIVALNLAGEKYVWDLQGPGSGNNDIRVAAHGSSGKSLFLLSKVLSSNDFQRAASNVNVTVFAFLALVSALMAQSSDATKLERQVSGQVLTSAGAPAVHITFDKRYKYAGVQRFILNGVAEAEQHFFVQASADGKIQSFYWLQFEHYLPTNGNQYEYPPKRTMDLGGLMFVHDTT